MRAMLYYLLANWLPKVGAGWRIHGHILRACLPLQKIHWGDFHLEVEVAFHHIWVYLRISCLLPLPPAPLRWYQGLLVWFSFCFLSLSDLISLQERSYLRLFLCMRTFMWYSFKIFLKKLHHIMVCLTVKKEKKKKKKLRRQFNFPH